jgi:hypothetical protein
MSQGQAVAEAVKPAGSTLLAVAPLRGRIVGKPRQYKARDGSRRYATVLRLPNPDEFTTLGQVEVDSAEALGDDGDTWAGRVRLSGNVRTFGYVDKTTGEKREGREFAAKLTVLL